MNLVHHWMLDQVCAFGRPAIDHTHVIAFDERLEPFFNQGSKVLIDLVGFQNHNHALDK